MKTERGAALILVLAILGVGAVLLPATLSYTSTALKYFSVSQESTEVVYDLDAVTQHALWELEYDTEFMDCDDPADSIVDSFADCVAMRGSWTLATAGKLQSIFNETQVDYLNGQEVSVTVEVPGALSAPPEPTPTPSTSHCLYAWVERDTDPTKAGNQTWAMVGDPITYTVHVWNCSDKTTNLRRLVVMLSPEFSYVTGSSVEPNAGTNDPEQTNCDLAAPSPTIANPTYCTTYTSNVQGSLIMGWPGLGYADDNYGGGSTISVDSGQTVDLVFQATLSSFGVYYIDATVCFFSATSGDPGPCTSGNLHNSGKVAPVVAGMFNINGNGKGHAYGASARKDGNGSGLISQNPN